MPARYRALWTTPGGGSGFSVFHFTTAGNGTAAQTIADQIQDFFELVDGILPESVSVAYDSEVLDIAEDGTLIAVWGVTPPTTTVGDAAGDFAQAAGGVLNWATDAIVAGRRLSGRTYIVPLVGSAFATTGELDAAVVTTLEAAANGLITDTSFNRPLRVWSPTHDVSAVVTGVVAPTQGAILRGRRD